MSVEVLRYAGQLDMSVEAVEQTVAQVAATATGVYVTGYSGSKPKHGYEYDARHAWKSPQGSDTYSFNIRPAQREAASSSRQPSERVLRRFDGFLVEDEGEEYKVAFVENGSLVFYYLPSNQLRKAGITAPNQPFQMDEVEVQLSTGRLITGYSFTPLAKSTDAFNDSIELTEERRRKLAAIFDRFGKAKD